MTMDWLCMKRFFLWCFAYLDRKQLQCHCHTCAESPYITISRLRHHKTIAVFSLMRIAFLRRVIAKLQSRPISREIPPLRQVLHSSLSKCSVHRLSAPPLTRGDMGGFLLAYFLLSPPSRRGPSRGPTKKGR
jgi:hypothetical protein